MLALARPDAADVIADELVALARRARLSHGRDDAARGAPPLLRGDRRVGDVGVREHRARVGRRGAAAGTWGRRSSRGRSTASTSTSAASRVRPTGTRWWCRPATATGSTGPPRAAFLAELVAARDAIVVTGAHGKTTTTGMIAYALRAAGGDPAWIVGGVVPQLGGNAGGGGGLLVVEGDESDRSVFALRPRVAVVTNVELDHHATYGSVEELRDALDAWLAAAPEASAAGSSRRTTARSPYRARTTARTRPARSRRSSASASTDRGPRRDRVVHGGRAAPRARRRARRRDGDRRLRAQPDRAARGAGNGARADRGRLVAVYVPHVVERTRHLHHELGAALGLADVAVVTDFVGQRDAPREGVTGRLVLESVPDPTRRGLGADPGRRRAARRSHVVGPGDVVVTLGVGEPWRAARAIVVGASAHDDRARGGRRARAADDDRHGRACTCVRARRGRSTSSGRRSRGRGSATCRRRGRARVERPRRGHRGRRARAAPRGRARRGRRRGGAASRGRRCRERRLPAPGARRRSRRARVRVRDPRDGRRGRADERRRLRLATGRRSWGGRSSSPPTGPAGGRSPSSGSSTGTRCSARARSSHGSSTGCGRARPRRSRPRSRSSSRAGRRRSRRTSGRSGRSSRTRRANTAPAGCSSSAG